MFKIFKRYFTPDTITSYQKGAGGRSSFNGVVATIFGSTGYVGETVVNYLGRQGTQIIIAHREDRFFVDKLKLYGDLGQILFCYYQPNDIDENDLYKSMKYSNVVINTIGKYVETNNFTFEEVHVNLPKKIARIARECGVKKFIHLSHIAAHEDNIPGPTLLNKNQSHRILKSKFLGEKAVLEEFPNATILKPSTLFGKGDHFLNFYSNSSRHVSTYSMPLWKLGEHTIKSPLYVFDLVRAIGKIASPLTPLESVAGKTFYLTGPYAYTLAELCDWMHQVMHQEPGMTPYQRTELGWKIWLKARLPPIVPWERPLYNWDTLEMEFVSEEVSPTDLTFEDLGILERVDINAIGNYILYGFRVDATYDRYHGTKEYYEYLPPLEYPAPRALYKA